MPEASAGDVVRVRRVGPVLIVTLDRPERRNAVNAAMSTGLEAALDELESDDDLRVGVLEATGPVFCAGSDLLEGPGPATPKGGEYGFIRRRRTKPVIAAVEGPALGGGFELVLACDLVVAARGATFSLPEASRGRVPNAGALFRAADRLPRNVATELMLTGARLDSEHARVLGLVNRLVGNGNALAAALELALDVCDSAPASVRAVLAARHALDAEFEAAGWSETSDAVTATGEVWERAEGTSAFRERRPPAWRPDRGLVRASWRQA